MIQTSPTHTELVIKAAGYPLRLLRGGQGDPVLVLHQDIGSRPDSTCWRQPTPATTGRSDRTGCGASVTSP
jgi:hypothetical protein